MSVSAAGQAGPPGQECAGPDRIEHAGIVPPGYSGELARLGLAVVTQPGFIAARAFRWKRERDRLAAQLEQKDLASRRHHFRGAADVELVTGPTDQGPLLPPAVDPDGRDRG